MLLPFQLCQHSPRGLASSHWGGDWTARFFGFVDRDYEMIYPLGPGKIFKGAPAEKGSIPDEQTFLNEYIYKTGNSSLTPFEFFIETQAVTWSFVPMPESESTLVEGYMKTVVDAASAGAAVEMQKDLIKISDDIRNREKATADKYPAYAALDPKVIPYYTYI